MNEGLIPGRYAKALLKLASEKGVDARMYVLMNNLSEAFAESPDLVKLAGNPFVSQQDKVRLLSTAAGAGSEDTLFTDFLSLLSRNKRISVIREAALSYVAQYRKAHKIYKVNVTAAAPMDAQEEDRLKKLIETHLGGGSMEYSFNVDPDQIGGFTVTIDSERLDASVANELKQLRHALLNK